MLLQHTTVLCFILLGSGCICYPQSLIYPKSYEVDGAFESANIRVITPLHSSFLLELKSHVPGDVISAVNSLLPYSFLIENKGPLPITCVVLRYRKTNRAGKTVFSTIRLLSPPGDTTGQAVPVGAIRLLLPSGELSGLAAGSTSFQLSRVGPLIKAAGSGFRSELTADVVATLDSVILSTGRIVGPDKLDLIREAKAREIAAAEFSAEIHTLLATGAGRESLMDFARRETEIAPDLAADGAIDFYRLARRSLARAIFSFLESRPIGELETMLANQRARSKEHGLHR